MQKITADFVQKIAEPGRYWDGDSVSGYHILCQASTRKSQANGLRKYYAQRVQLNGRRINLTLGRVIEDDTLAKTIKAKRMQAHDYAAAARQGIDPRQTKREAKSIPAVTMPEIGKIPTFRELMHKVCKTKMTNRTKKYRKAWMQLLRLHARPLLDQPVNEISPSDIVNVLEPIWTTKHQTARDVRRAIRLIFDRALFERYITHHPADRALDTALPTVKQVRQAYRHIPYDQVAAAINKIIANNSRSSVTGCLFFIALTAVRSQEARGATWDEIDWENRLWTIGADRMKTRKQHVVPLSTLAMRLLEVAYHNYTCATVWRIELSNGRWTESEGKIYKQRGDKILIFPGRRKSQPLTAAALSEACKRNGLECSPHGFRKSFRTWCGETRVDREVAELCLSHRIGNQVEQIYNRADLLEQRREVMQQWADYLNQPTTGE